MLGFPIVDASCGPKTGREIFFAVMLRTFTSAFPHTSPGGHLSGGRKGRRLNAGMTLALSEGVLFLPRVCGNHACPFVLLLTDLHLAWPAKCCIIVDAVLSSPVFQL